MTGLYAGVDIGTSSCRCIVFDENGFEKHAFSVEYSLITSKIGYAELNAEEICSAFNEVVKNAKKIGVKTFGLSCQMHSLIAVDKNGNAMTNVITWADTRAADEAVYISQNFDVQKLYEKTGCRTSHPMYPLSKILWLKKNLDNFENVFKFITIKEYIIYRLCGEFIVDMTLASSQGYYNLNDFCWDEEILTDILGISINKLSRVVECDYTFSDNSNSKYIIGSGDGILANYGCGIVDDTMLSSTIGTSGAIRTAVNKPLLDVSQRTWCYAFKKDMWVAGGAINNGGIALKWLRSILDGDYRTYDILASDIPVGSEGLVFLPVITGERSPDWRSDVRGMMLNIDIRHERKHIIRACMEGVVYRLFSIYEVMAALNKNAVSIIANGGYVKSDVWLQIQADVFGKEIIVNHVSECSALGAAYMAMQTDNFNGKLKAFEPIKHIKPNMENHEQYKEYYANAIKLYNKVNG